MTMCEDCDELTDRVVEVEKGRQVCPLCAGKREDTAKAADRLRLAVFADGLR